MGDSEKENVKDISYNFDIESELSALVAKNIISSRIADKLGKKIKEKNIKITKEQLNTLVEKIKSIMQNYKKYETPTKTSPSETPSKTTTTIKPDENMQKLVETIEKLELRINNLENILSGKKDTENTIITTDDIKLPDEKEETKKSWSLEPLTKIPNDPESIVVLMKWLQYLIDKCGRDNLSNILDYYVDIGWISQDAKISLIEYSHGIADERKKGEQTTIKKTNDLTSKDHIQSLVFIQKLKGKQLDKHFIERIDGEITRLTKKLDNYNFK